jgi:hypothetical protein
VLLQEGEGKPPPQEGRAGVVACALLAGSVAASSRQLQRQCGEQVCAGLGGPPGRQCVDKIDCDALGV